MIDGTYEGANHLRVVYHITQGDGAGTDAQFVRVCDQCGRIVKAPDTIKCNGLGELSKEPNAECSRCGPTHMLFEGFFSEGDR